MKKVLTLITVTLLLGACGQKQNTTRTAGRTVGAAGVNGPGGNVAATYNLNSSWSAISGATLQTVTDLISTNPSITVGQDFGSSSCHTLNNQQCAVVFNVAVNPGVQSTSPLTLSPNPSTPGGYQTTGSGMLTIAIYDSLTGNGTSAIAVAVPLSNGQVIYQGNTGVAYVIFQDGAGSITVGLGGKTSVQNGSPIANVQGENFIDVVSFANATGTNPGYDETLGNFSTNVCGIFQCFN